MFPTLLVYFFLISSVLSFCPKLFDNQTACSCESTVEGPVIRCSGTDGLLIVDKLRSWKLAIKEFALENANIIEIGPRAFKNLQIKKLNLDKNRIQRIHENAFKGLENVLQELSISENNLPEVPTQALAGLKSLNILNLKCNKIGNITRKVFLNVPSLIDLNLACNQICEVSPNAFADVKLSLQNLILDRNCMITFPHSAVKNMINLIALHMKYNKVTSLNQNDISNLTSLSMVSLNGNNITKINGAAFSNTPNLRYLYLNENQIQNFDSGVMEQFKQVQVIDLSFNNISEITTEMFRGLESIQHLNLDSNRIRTVFPGAFSGTPLLLLWLPNNCLTEVTQATFQGAPFLRMVSLSNNKIETIQAQSFGHLANLHTLDLANNNIVSLQNESLAGTENLSVRLQENPLVCTSNGFHVWNGNEAINLTGEVNAICKTNWREEKNSLCQEFIQRPVPLACCTDYHPTTVLLETTTKPMASRKEKTEASEDSLETVTRGEKYNSEQNETRSEEKELDEKNVTKSNSLLVSTTLETTSVMKDRKVNMERFWRLSKGPSGNSPFMRHTEGNKPKYLQTTTKPAKLEESDEEESNEAEYLTDEEEENDEHLSNESLEEGKIEKSSVNLGKQKTENTKNSDERKIVQVPARIRERQKMFASNLLPWMAPRIQQESSDFDFDKDDSVETVPKTDN